MQKLFTNGHSSHKPSEFLELIDIHGFDLFADARKTPLAEVL